LNLSYNEEVIYFLVIRYLNKCYVPSSGNDYIKLRYFGIVTEEDTAFIGYNPLIIDINKVFGLSFSLCKDILNLWLDYLNIGVDYPSMGYQFMAIQEVESILVETLTESINSDIIANLFKLNEERN